MGKSLAFLFSILFALAPFLFGIVRRLNSHQDLVVLWMALTSAVIAALVYALSRTRPSLSTPMMAIVTLILCTVAAALAAFRTGATGSAGVWAVATVIGICWALSFWLRSYARKVGN